MIREEPAQERTDAPVAKAGGPTISFARGLSARRFSLRAPSTGLFVTPDNGSARFPKDVPTEGLRVLFVYRSALTSFRNQGIVQKHLAPKSAGNTNSSYCPISIPVGPAL